MAVLALLVSSVAVTAPASPGSAQEGTGGLDEPPTTVGVEAPPTTTAPAPVPTAAPESVPVTDPAPPVPDSAPVEPVEPAQHDEAHAEVVPGDDVPAVAAPVAPPGDLSAPSPEQQRLADDLAARLDRARLGLMVALGHEAQAADELVLAEDAVVLSRARLSTVRRHERRAETALAAQRARVRRWAVEAYTGGSLRRVAFVLESERIQEVPRRVALAGGAFGAFDESARNQEEDVERLAGRRRRLEHVVAGAEARVELARAGVSTTDAEVARHRQEVAALDAGQAAGTTGLAFPVQGPTRFADTFGAPRMFGTRFAHAHEGVDIFAPPGTPVVAFEPGVVVRLGTDVLGGTKLWLAGVTGTRYYYAHLDAYAPGLTEGQAVKVGQTLATVGNTGNARFTPPHLHFEIHPPGGPVVNPYPLLAQIVASAPPPPGPAPPPTGPEQPIGRS